MIHHLLLFSFTHSYFSIMTSQSPHSRDRSNSSRRQDSRANRNVKKGVTHRRGILTNRLTNEFANSTQRRTLSRYRKRSSPKHKTRASRWALPMLQKASKEAISIAELQRSSHESLLQIAESDGLEEFAGLSKQDLIFRILKQRMAATGLMYGEGTLEILPDGFGFLRALNITICLVQMTSTSRPARFVGLDSRQAVTLQARSGLQKSMSDTLRCFELKPLIAKIQIVRSELFHLRN